VFFNGGGHGSSKEYDDEFPKNFNRELGEAVITPLSAWCSARNERKEIEDLLGTPVRLQSRASIIARHGKECAERLSGVRRLWKLVLTSSPQQMEGVIVQLESHTSNLEAPNTGVIAEGTGMPEAVTS
jgi:hypothetical protein